jgi:pyruvate/2-oxoglutarate dehydrogenase complex dihydrolipoamide dehydrogenase (E3) component
VFSEPHVASVGTACGDQVVTAMQRTGGGASFSTRARPARPGLLEAGTNDRVIVGVFAIGPEAGRWSGQLTLAVLARTPLETLLDIAQPYPSSREPAFGVP